MTVYSDWIKSRLRENREKVEEIESCFPLSPILQKLHKYLAPAHFLGKHTMGSRRMKAYAWRMKKREALQLLDDIFWSNGLETTNPKIEKGEMKVTYTDQKSLCTLEIELGLQEGDGCRKVFVGYERSEKYEWICDEKEISND
jgi:hypothetical protein